MAHLLKKVRPADSILLLLGGMDTRQHRIYTLGII